MDFLRVWHEWQAQLCRLSIFVQQLANLALRPQTGPFHAIAQRRSLLFIPQLLNSPAKFLPAFVHQPLKILAIKKSATQLTGRRRHPSTSHPSLPQGRCNVEARPGVRAKSFSGNGFRCS
jgi:hypothetical protein